MISYIKGTVLEKKPDILVVLVGGIGYDVRAPAGTIDRAPDPGGEVALHTCMVVRQDLVQLFGFDSPRARQLFVKLTSVSGFGAAKALSVLSIFPPDRFEAVVRSGDTDALTIIPGVGKKGAERLILEMKDKFEPGTDVGPAMPDGEKFVFQEAAEALVALDFTRLEAHDLLRKYPRDQGEPTIEELLQFALRQKH